MVNPKAQACDARNYFFLSSFDFTAEGVKLVKTRFEHELKEIAEVGGSLTFSLTLDMLLTNIFITV